MIPASIEKRDPLALPGPKRPEIAPTTSCLRAIEERDILSSLLSEVAPLHFLFPFEPALVQKLVGETAQPVHYFAPLEGELPLEALKELHALYQVAYVLTCSSEDVETSFESANYPPNQMRSVPLDSNVLWPVAELIHRCHLQDCQRSAREPSLGTEDIFYKLRRNKDSSLGWLFLKDETPVGVLVIDKVKKRPVLKEGTLHISYLGVLEGEAVLTPYERQWVFASVARHLKGENQLSNVAVSALVDASDRQTLHLFKDRGKFRIRALRLEASGWKGEKTTSD